jgi:hypothetical protein
MAAHFCAICKTLASTTIETHVAYAYDVVRRLSCRTYQSVGRAKMVKQVKEFSFFGKSLCDWIHGHICYSKRETMTKQVRAPFGKSICVWIYRCIWRAERERERERERWLQCKWEHFFWKERMCLDLWMHMTCQERERDR